MMMMTLRIAATIISVFAVAGAADANMVMAPTSGSSSPWALIAHTFVVCNDGSGTCDSGATLTTPAINTTGADLIVVAGTNAVGSGLCLPASSISDNKGNTWSTAISVTEGGANVAGLKIQYFRGGTVGTGHTFALAPECFTAIYVLAFSGSVASPLDQTNSQTTGASVSSIASGSITPTVSNALIISSWVGDTHGVTGVSVDSGLTQADPSSGGVNLQYFPMGLAYYFQPTAAAINPTWSWTTSQSAAAAVASFKP